MITFTVGGLGQLFFDVVIVLVLVKLAMVTWRLDQFKKGLIAHAKKLPSPPSKQLIDGWKPQYDTLPKGSPKHIAYKNRLIEIGVLDDEGNEVKTEEASGD